MKQTVKTSRAAGQLEKMFRELNKHYFNGILPEPVISHMDTSPVVRSGKPGKRANTKSIYHPQL